MYSKHKTTEWILDVLCAIVAGIIVGSAYHLFQNSNGFAPGGVGGLATITYHFFGDKASWSVLMIAYNLPIFILVSRFVNKKLGFMLTIYILMQSVIPNIYEWLGIKAYCLQNNGEDFNVFNFKALELKNKYKELEQLFRVCNHGVTVVEV